MPKKGAEILPMDRPQLTYTDEELLELSAALEPLTKHPGWIIFSRVLKDAVIAAQEQGFANLPDVVRWAGRADGLRQAWELPQLIVSAAKKSIGDEVIRAEKRGPVKAPRRSFEDDQLTS